jgi:EmrB/QacA subfamily drug resistance transporter
MPVDKPRTHYHATFAVLATATIAYALLQSLVIPVLATIQAGLHTSQNSVTWVLTAYLLSASIFTPIVGRLGDMFGKERMLVLALVALAAGCVLSALTSSLPIMLGGRVIQGIGGGVLPLSFGLIRDEFPAEKVPGAVGIIAALAAAGAGLGIVLAGPIVDALNYHWLFWIPMIILVAAAVAARVVVPESRVRSAGRVSWLGGGLLSAWLVALILAVSEAPRWGWTSGKVIGLIVAAIILACVWVFAENRSAHPLIDMSMMRIPTVWTTNLVALLLGVGMYAAFAFLPQYLETPPSVGYGFGASITVSGLILLPMSVGMFIFGSLSGRFSARYGTRAVLIAGTAIGAVPFVLLTIARAHQWEILIAMVLLGIGFGLAYSAMSNLVVQGVPPEQTGVASGMNANIRTIGGSLGSAIMSSIVTSGAHPHGFPRDAGYTQGFLALTIAAVGAAAASLLVPRIVARGFTAPSAEIFAHAEMALVAGGTVAGDEPE